MLHGPIRRGSGCGFGQFRDGISRPRFVGANQHGDLTWLAKPGGIATTNTRTYTPYGETHFQWSPTDPTPEYGYQTQYTDPTTGDILMQSRWYTPGTGTFRSRDTYSGNLNTPVSLNRYTYAGNNPIRYSDPTGFCFEICDGRVTNQNTFDWVSNVTQLSPIRHGNETRTYFYTSLTDRDLSVSVQTDDSVETATYETNTHVMYQYTGGRTSIAKNEVTTGIDFIEGGFDAAEAALFALDYAARNPVAAIKGVAASTRCGNAGLNVVLGAGGCFGYNLADGFRQGIAESYNEGGADQAAGRATAEVLSVLFGMRGMAGIGTVDNVVGSSFPHAIDDFVDLPGPQVANQAPVVFSPPVAGATPAQVAQIRGYVQGCNAALCDNALSPSGRVSTQGQLTVDASRMARIERTTNPAAYPGSQVVGHVPDTTWNGVPQPHSWMALDRSINSSLGRQAQNYPIGYQPTGFWYIDDYLAEFGGAPP